MLILYDDDLKPISIFWKCAKALGIGLLIALVLVEIWALFWFMCALDDVCYAANTGGL